jgi:hypothetical protein
MQLALSGPLSLVPLVYHYATTLSVGKALRAISLVFCVFGATAIISKHASLFKRELDYQAQLTEQAILKDAGCAKIDDILRYDKGVDETCTEARRIVSTSALERAIAETVEGWPTPWDVGAYLLVSFENKITTLGFAAYVMATVRPYCVGPPMQMLQGRYVANKIHKLHSG